MLLHTVEVYLRRTGMPPTSFGRAAASDPCFVRDLRRGRVVGERVRRRVVAYLESARHGQ